MRRERTFFENSRSFEFYNIRIQDSLKFENDFGIERREFN